MADSGHVGRTHANSAIRDADVTWLLEQRLRGLTIRQIAAATPEGIGRQLSRSAVHKAIERELTKRKEPTLAAVRELELQRLDNLEHVASGLLEERGNSLAAIDRLIKIGERRAKLKGLDAPVQIQQEQTVRYEIVGIDPEALR